MKKRIVVIGIILILLINVIIYVFLKIKQKEYSSNAIKNSNISISENLPKEIQIYDIEDGYLTVEYNSKANLHQYNWNKLVTKNKNNYLYDDNQYTTKLGIDISTYQGEIDWKKVKDAGIDFAILRLGFRGYGQKGTVLLDDKFEENIKKAVEEKIDVGVYFFSQAITTQEAIEEAEFVLEKIKNQDVTYPVFFDLERIKFDKARTDDLTPNEITNITIAFCEEIKKAGYVPSIYGNAKTFTTRMHLEKLNQYQKWYADYQQNPLYPYDFDIWQYTEKGKIPGIKGNVDLNLQFIAKE